MPVHCNFPYHQHCVLAVDPCARSVDVPRCCDLAKKSIVFCDRQSSDNRCSTGRMIPGNSILTGIFLLLVSAFSTGCAAHLKNPFQAQKEHVASRENVPEEQPAARCPNCAVPGQPAALTAMPVPPSAPAVLQELPAIPAVPNAEYSPLTQSKGSPPGTPAPRAVQPVPSEMAAPVAHPGISESACPPTPHPDVVVANQKLSECQSQMSEMMRTLEALQTTSEMTRLNLQTMAAEQLRLRAENELLRRSIIENEMQNIRSLDSLSALLDEVVIPPSGAGSGNSSATGINPGKTGLQSPDANSVPSSQSGNSAANGTETPTILPAVDP